MYILPTFIKSNNNLIICNCFKVFNSQSGNMDARKVVFENNFSLDFGASNQKRIYGFLYENFENDILKNQIFYEVEVDFLNDRYGNNCVFEIDRKQIFINNKTSRSHLEQIADQAGQTIFPLRIKIKKNGAIEKILNHDLIKQRWTGAKTKLLTYYKGEKIPKTIAKIETVLLNENLLEKALHQNWFFHLFFNPLYISYTEKLRCKYIWESPIFGNQSIKYGAVHTIKEHYSVNDKININVNGIAIDERTIDEITSGYHFSKSKMAAVEVLELEPVDSQFNIDYQLYAEDRSIFSITGSFETRIDENTQDKIKTEIYHLPENASFRPWSDAAQKEGQRIFDSYQIFDNDDDIIDIVSVSKRYQREQTEPERILGPPREPIQLYVHEEPNLITKTSFWNKIKSVFKKQ